MINRRHALKTIALISGAVALASPSLSAQTTPAPPSEGVFKLPALGYDYDALEPYIDAATMKLHHDKHHAAYVSKLNEAAAGVAGPEKKTIEDLLADLDSVPEGFRTHVRQFGGGHANHTLLWETLKKNDGARPAGLLGEEIARAFGSFERFQQLLGEAGVRHFGSGWAWLALREGKLVIETTNDQDSPLMTNAVPLLGIDVWEHAYYLTYQDRRAEYVEALSKITDWEVVSRRYAAARAAA